MSFSSPIRKFFTAAILSVTVGFLASVILLLMTYTFEELGSAGKIEKVTGLNAIVAIIRSLGYGQFLRTMWPMFAFASIIFFLGYTAFGKRIFK